MVAYHVVNPIVDNVEILGEVAEAVFQGDLSQKAVINSNDEVALLGTAMNTMTNRLVADIERRRKVEEELKAEIGERVRMEKEHEALQIKA